MLRVFASFAEDILLDERRNELKRQIGGPAYFIQNALERLGAEFELTASTPAQVELIMTNAGETNTKLVAKAAAFTPRYANMACEGALISTTINEIELNGLEYFKGLVFIDAQGYVRNPEDSSRRMLWQEGKNLNVFCLKATESEVKFLPGNLVRKQKKKLLIISKGGEGLDLYWKGKLYYLSLPNPVIGRDTIGAGDTLLANFAVRYLHSGDAVMAANLAMDSVRKFLLEKPELKNLGVQYK